MLVERENEGDRRDVSKRILVNWYSTKIYDGGSSEMYEPFIKIKFVHQLQNLYFALTGEELTIKE